MEFLIVIQKPGESPGFMEVYGFYDSEGQVVNVVRVLKRGCVTFGVYRLYEPVAGGREKAKEPGAEEKS